MANEKLGVATEPSPENLGGLELCFGGTKPTKASPWQQSCVAKLQLALNAIDSEKYLGYAICHACKICQTFCL